VERPGALLEIVREVNAVTEPPALAGVIVECAAVWIPAPCWAVVSSDLSGQLAVLASRGVSNDLEASIYAVASYVMHQGGEFISADLRADTRVSGQAAGTVLAFPLTSRDIRVGALVGLDRSPSSREPRLPPTMMRAVRVLLEPAAAALDNALQYKRIEALSVTDDLTHLYNSRYLNKVLRRETKRSIRGGRPLSLLFIDLDGFKSINDAHGHLSGSRALVEAAAVVQGSARETDVVARFGGDEFALVLPETGVEGAIAVGERIRQRLAAHRFLAADGFDIHLTASVGVATLPDVATSPEELMQAADMAMYLVKQSGKNGIQAATAPADK
jgi:diguanylate cyclase (GGDEF)-like protein